MGDSRIHQVIEQSVLSVAKAVEDKLDEEISNLEKLDVDDLEALRERRILQMKKAAEKKSRWAALGHGEYSEIVEKDFFSAVKASDRVVCHFYRENWPCKRPRRITNQRWQRSSGDDCSLAGDRNKGNLCRCSDRHEEVSVVMTMEVAMAGGAKKVMDKHLNILSKQHMETRFLKIHAEKSPFLTEKLKIVVLPTLALIKNAKVDDYVVGFDELGGSDEFGTEDLEERLARSGVIALDGDSSFGQIKSGARPQQRSVRQSENNSSSDSD